MMITPRSSIRRCAQRAGRVAVPAFVVLLASCGAPERSTPAVPETSIRPMPEVSSRAVREASTSVAPEAYTPVTPERSAGSVPVAVGMRDGGAGGSSPLASPGVAGVQPSSFELVGTSISATSAFAILKAADQRLVTVHEGDRIDGYTIAAIAPDRVKMRSPGNDEQLLKLLVATGEAAAPAMPIANTTPDIAASTRSIAQHINTDQSIPERVMFGPTASLPDGVKQMGH